MIKIKYPQNTLDFEKDYLKIYKNDRSQIESAINSFIKDNSLFFNLQDKKINTFLKKKSGNVEIILDKLFVASYEELYLFVKEFDLATAKAMNIIQTSKEQKLIITKLEDDLEDKNKAIEFIQEKIKNDGETPADKKKLKKEEKDKKSLSEKLKKEKDVSGRKKKNFEKKLNYSKHQKSISNHFVKYRKQIDLATCYYCNLEYINAIDFHQLASKYEDVDEILLKATKEELNSISGLGPKMCKDILDSRKSKVAFNKYRNHEKLLKIWRNQFEIDHFLGKDYYPIASLSLYNFVPSCHTCNARFKVARQLKDIRLCPTSNIFNFESDVLFSLKFSSSNKNFQVKNLNDFLLFLDIWNEKYNYEDYIDVFKLNQRSAFHKYEVLDLIEKSRRYGESQINEIAQITKRTSLEVKKDIFGKNLFEEEACKEPKTKLLRDVAKLIGIEGVKIGDSNCCSISLK